MAILTNHRHERFALCIAEGMSGLAAYNEAYGKTGNVAKAAASRLLNNIKVKARVAELQMKAEGEMLLTLKRKRQILGEIAEGKRPSKVTASDKGSVEVFEPVRAIELDAKLAGEFKEKVEVKADGIGELLKMIRNGR